MHKTKPTSPSSSSQYNYPHVYRTAYGPKLSLQSINTLPSRTKQAHKAECDINQIMARYLRTGVIDAQQRHAPRYADCTGLEFQAMQNQLIATKNMFNELPAQLRDRFDNDPAAFLTFVQDAKNLEEARELGLLKPKASEATPLPTPPASDAPTPPLASRDAMRKQARADGERKAGKETDY